MLVDTHCHLGDAAFEADVAEVVARAAARGVGRIVVVGESPEASIRALDLADRYPGLSATAGVHPHGADQWSPASSAWLAALLPDARVVAVGETGLDYHYDHAPRDRQREAFEAQLDLAAGAGKPAVIHAREADADVAEILGHHPRAVAVLHSFSGGDPLLDAGLALGHYVSFSGMVTFRNWGRDAAIRRVPADRLLLETDAPYLAPVPHRGKRNEPAFLREVAARIAAVRGIGFDELCALTSRNAAQVFGDRLGKNGGVS